MKSHGPWSTSDFPELSWHDVHVHGVKLQNYDMDSGRADLVLDIDFITDWIQDGSECRFGVCPAELCFEGVSDYQMVLDYAGSTAGMCPFSIAEIQRETKQYPNGYAEYQWHVKLNWPAGYLKFSAPGFTQRLVGRPRVQKEQWLRSEHRGGNDA
ncbi:MAG: hypothetical protein U0795_20940 [Pirellulales bacterium]